MLVVPTTHDDQRFHLQNFQSLQALQNLQHIRKIQQQREHLADADAAADPLSALSLTSSPDLDFNLDSDFDLSLDFDPDNVVGLSMLGAGDRAMQQLSDPWQTNHSLGHQQPHPNNHNNINLHQRESSLSSLGSASAGPASPFSQNTSNPHIAVSDASLVDGLSAMPSYYDDASPFQQQLLKPAYAQGHAAAYAPHTLPAVYHSRPVSVASSIASNSNSPATPSLDQADDHDARRRNGENTAPMGGLGSLGGEGWTQLATAREQDEDLPFVLDGVGGNEDDEDDECSRFFNDLVAYHAPPKFDRSMTDVYNDELYSPSFPGPTSAASPAPTSVTNGNGQDMFARRLQQFNNQNLGAASHPSPVSNGAAGSQSPFHSSPMTQAPSQDFGRFGPVHQTQQQQQHQHQQQQHQQQQQQCQVMDASQAFRSQAKTEGAGTPQTISPKDALLDYREHEADSSFPLLSPGSTQAFNMSPSYGNMNGMGQAFGYGSQMVSNLQLSQQYPFLAQQANTAAPQAVTRAPPAITSAPATTTGTAATAGTKTTTRLPGLSGMRPITASLARSGLVQPVPNSQRPGLTDGATYTCTYHGCTQRFETPTLLQKHKREGHRQANAPQGGRKADGSDASLSPSMLNSQAGPHRCERINPGTGKPCNTIFSRPYDLTRHEDTIHNARKQKVRCNLCTEDKTFSRADALTRHFRVCHPDVDFPGKHRKRGAHAE